MTRPLIRTLAKQLGVIHNISYYAPELRVFQERGIDEFWHGYIAFRSAPMGRVEAGSVISAFYNFAPPLVHAAVPSVWDVVTPAEAMAMRGGALDASLSAIYTSADEHRDAVRVADLVIDAMADLSGAGRPLFASYQPLDRPESPVMQLWHATTLWREFRGDGHNIALAHEGIDGIECHVLLAGRGIGNREVIEKIRGWDGASWDGATQRLVARGLVDATGMLTESGTALRRHIEDETDRLAEPAMAALGPESAEETTGLLAPLVETLVASGVVPDQWPPPKSRRP